jgi:hypothetical protein
MSHLRDELQAALGDGDTLERELGGGGMARVFVAQEQALGHEGVPYDTMPFVRGIVHRDIKPETVLLSRGTAVVTDVGIAKARSAATTKAEGSTLISLGTSIGPPAYMAPEQAPW